VSEKEPRPREYFFRYLLHMEKMWVEAMVLHMTPGGKMQGGGKGSRRPDYERNEYIFFAQKKRLGGTAKGMPLRGKLASFPWWYSNKMTMNFQR